MKEIVHGFVEISSFFHNKTAQNAERQFGRKVFYGDITKKNILPYHVLVLHKMHSGDNCCSN